MPKAPVCLVVGAGDALGGAIAERFGREGFEVCIARRDAAKLEALAGRITSAGGRPHAFSLDARNEAAVVSLFDAIEMTVGPLDVVAFNVGMNVRSSILDMTTDLYRESWEMGALSGFLVGREAARRMVPRGRGTILLTGATASVRGRALYAAFTGGKAALRNLAQSMARELGPKGIHVAHIVVDGVIEGERARTRLPHFAELKSNEGMLDPAAIAENYWMLHKQPRNSWTHELDVRPWIETW
jgi:NAD(P)-dependent dehydrogenase (short-subunit alcohol dehydrogenase family)